jgi:hypothetical protein
MTRRKRPAVKRARRRKLRAAAACPVSGVAISPAPRTRGGSVERRETKDEAQATVLTARCVRAGIEPTLENRRRMNIPEIENALGRAMLAGLLTRRQMHAGLEYAILDAEWRRAKGLPRLWPRAAAVERVSPGEGMDAPERQARLLAALSSATGHVKRTAGPQAVARLREVAVMDADAAGRLDTLRAALDALIVHFGMGEAG